MQHEKQSGDMTIIRLTGKRVALSVAGFLVFGLVFYALHNVLDLPGAGITITFSILFGLPFCIGALTVLLVDASGRKRVSAGWLALYVTMTVLVVGAVFLREGVICIAILAPVWAISCLFGAWAVTSFQREMRSKLKLNSAALFMLPFLMMGVERYIPQVATGYVVQREIIIDAAPEAVWPHLLRMDEIRANEGRWNVTQNLFAVPRPVSAVVVGEGVGAVRHAGWGAHVTFEERITYWDEGRALRWNFVFPNDSVHKHTDEYISPDGMHLRIGEGGYRLEALDDNRTRLVLYTTYQAQTPINAYARLWGELFLGDIQGNILEIVKDRAERSAQHQNARFKQN